MRGGQDDGTRQDRRCVGTRCIVDDNEGNRWTVRVTQGHDGYIWEVDGQLR